MTISRVPDHARAWLLAHPAARSPEAARALRVSPPTARRYRALLVAEGLLPPAPAGGPGTDAPVAAIVDLARRGRNAAQIRAELGLHYARSTIAAIARAHGAPIGALYGRAALSLGALAALAGRPPRSATLWLAQCLAAGLCVAGELRPGARWMIRADDLRAWLADERSAALLPTAQITDPAWRAEAERLRAPAPALDLRDWRTYGRRRRPAP